MFIVEMLIGDKKYNPKRSFACTWLNLRRQCHMLPVRQECSPLHFHMSAAIIRTPVGAISGFVLTKITPRVLSLTLPPVSSAAIIRTPVGSSRTRTISGFVYLSLHDPLYQNVRRFMHLYCLRHLKLLPIKLFWIITIKFLSPNEVFHQTWI